jgi:hypothetical protein
MTAFAIRAMTKHCIALDRPKFLGTTNKSFRMDGGEGEIRTHESGRECVSYRNDILGLSR